MTQFLAVSQKLLKKFFAAVTSEAFSTFATTACQLDSLPTASAAISEARYYNTVFGDLQPRSNNFV